MLGRSQPVTRSFSVPGPMRRRPERALLAHELAHIVQQRTSQSPSNRIYRSPQENLEVMQAEEMNYLAVKNAWPVAIGSGRASFC